MTGKRSFVKAWRDMLTSEPLRTACPAAKGILLEMLARYTGKNNGNIHLSFRDAHKLLGMNKEAARRGFDDLEARGLIVCESVGRFRGQASKWRLTMFPTKDATATDEWRTWQPGLDLRPADRSDTEAEIEAVLAEARVA